MQNKVAAFAATPDPTFGSKPAAQPPVTGDAADPTPPIEDVADLRLVIEEDEATGSYVYKTVNRRTGEIVLQLPREQLLKMRDDLEYIAGDVIRTKA